jgi:hypothetical protein
MDARASFAAELGRKVPYRQSPIWGTGDEETLIQLIRLAISNPAAYACTCKQTLNAMNAIPVRTGMALCKNTRI